MAGFRSIFYQNYAIIRKLGMLYLWNYQLLSKATWYTSWGPKLEFIHRVRTILGMVMPTAIRFDVGLSHLRLLTRVGYRSGG